MKENTAIEHSRGAACDDCADGKSGNEAPCPGACKLWVPVRDSFFEAAALTHLGTGKLDLKRIKEMARELAS